MVRMVDRFFWAGALMALMVALMVYHAAGVHEDGGHREVVLLLHSCSSYPTFLLLFLPKQPWHAW
jgi:hypothetical protein